MTNIKGAYIAKSGTLMNYRVKIRTNNNAGGFMLINTNKGVRWGSFSTYGCISDTMNITFDSANNFFYAEAKEGRTSHIAYGAIVIAFSLINNIAGTDDI